MAQAFLCRTPSWHQPHVAVPGPDSAVAQRALHRHPKHPVFTLSEEWEQHLSEWVQKKTEEGHVERVRGSSFESWRENSEKELCSRRETRVKRGFSIF